ncbi:keratin%2C type I cytoskeletal 18-like [Scomber scombrus]|uniref:Keratin, type I cytoskeletal 18-like n=1 Tax=Scomber scombrus TaxID=13677 RepID=A0AAV1N7D0_SCOSC
MEHNFMRRQTSIGYHPPPSPISSSYAHSVSGGAGGYGTKISVAYGRGSGGYDYESTSSGMNSGALAIGNEKVAMQHLNDRLASYLETVRNLEKANGKLEIKIREAMEKRGPVEDKNYDRYNTIISELRAKILLMIKDNAHLAIAVDNARLASDDFRVKMEYELAMRQTVEADVARLRKLLDDTNVMRMHLESDIESLKEELITLKKNHEMDVSELRGQIHHGVHVDVDAPKGQDLARIMDEMRAKYELIAQKNQDEVKAWHESQITEVQGHVNEQSSALKDATNVVTETKRSYQALEIELQSELRLKENLKATLRDVEMRNSIEMEKYNAILLKLQDELTKIRADIHHSMREYEQLFNIKVKLEAEIGEYRRLLDGDFKLEDAVAVVKDPKVETKVVTITQRLVDGKVVEQSQDVQSA